MPLDAQLVLKAERAPVLDNVAHHRDLRISGHRGLDAVRRAQDTEFAHEPGQVPRLEGLLTKQQYAVGVKRVLDGPLVVGVERSGDVDASNFDAEVLV